MGWINDYYLDINIEQNYWVVNVGNFVECNVFLFIYIKDLVYYGVKIVEVVYGCKGWIVYIIVNVWGYIFVFSIIIWGLFLMVSLWIVFYLWI